MSDTATPQEEALRRRLRDVERLKSVLRSSSVEHEPDELRLLLSRVCMDNAFQFVGLLEPDGTNWEANQGALDAVSVRRSDIQGQPAWESPWFEGQEEGQRLLRALIARAAAGEFVRTDLEHRGGGGEEMVAVDFSLTPVRDAAGAVAFLVAEGRDVTVQRGLEREVTRQKEALEAANRSLQELDSLKSHFFANISHEFRTPLSLILGPTQQMLADPALPEAHRERLRGIRRNAETALRHVSDLLDLTRLEAGRLVLHYAHSDLASLVERCVAAFTSAASNRDIRLIADTKAPLPVECDPRRIEDVLHNLLANALKFTPPGGIVRCQCGGGEQVWIEVADSGPGIPLEMREKVFERFQQVTPDDGGGIGLGLAIARELVSLHEGRIWADAAPEGGTLMRLELPARAPAGRSVTAETAREPASIPVEGEPPAETEVPSERPDVLVIEDNPAMLRFVAEVLGDSRIVATASDGARGVELAKRLNPRMVVTDLMMPGMSGADVVRVLREDEDTRAIPIVLLSARADDEARLRLLRGGAQDYVHKPFAPEELRARVDNPLAIRRAHDALEQARAEAVRATAAKSRFLTMVTHDIRNPLANVQGLLELLQEDSLSGEQREIVDMAHASVGTLLKLLGDSLDLERIEAGQLELEEVPFSLEEIIGDITRLFARRAPQEVRVEVDYPVQVVRHVVGDARRVRQIILNLAGNALKFTRQGFVRVKVDEIRRDAASATLRVIVEDSGSGIPADRLPRIFDRFVQADSRHGGSGLGLAIVRELVERMGGTVGAHSDLGVGSQFWFELSLPLVSRATH